MSDTKSDKFVVKKLDKITETKTQVKPRKVSVEEPLVAIQHLRQHIRYIYKSPYTGKEHIWEGAGIVNVPKNDAEILLAKVRKVGGCCGSKPQSMRLFIRR